MKKPQNTTWRLAVSYLAIIMTLSLLFSGIIYAITSSQLDRPLPPPNVQNTADIQADMQARIDKRNEETRESVIISLLVLNGGMLLAGTVFSYYLARRTLRPIETAMAAQTQFVSDASHELRTPLTALLATNEVALRKPRLSEEKARAVLSKNINEIRKLQDLSDALLGLARTDQAETAVVHRPLSELVGEVVGQLQPLARKRDIRIETDVMPAAVTVHAGAFQQILTILLDNAIKYSGDHAVVTIMGDANTLSVRDQGIGIAPEDKAKIFDRFYRADTARTRTQTSGHGLGLAIAQSVAERNGYNIVLESELGKGSVFSLIRTR